MASTLSDSQLVARCRAGDQQAWNELVERFSRYVYAISVQAFRLPEADAEDVFQEVFARAYQHLDKLRDDSAVKPWLAQLTRRLCIDRLRATARERPVADEDLVATEADAEDVFQEVFARAYQHLDKLRDDAAVKPWLAQLTRRLCIDRLRAGARERPAAEEELAVNEPDETLVLLDEALAVHEALAAAPEHCREILDRFFARDESYRTIGEALDLPSGTIASRISRCLARLRAHMEGRSDGAGPSGDR